VWNLEKIINFHKGYAEIHIRRPFSNKNKNKKHMKNSWIENPNCGNML
jgi:hypothetical protein